ncbi:MAG: DUF421 domain-containing protein [Clostridia bacterium]|nr:DUF421 domain-containing protein [Clostridia bacterium]
MLILFLRAVLIYIFVLFVLRLTGKRQVSDLQPFDLLITLTIADLASCAIADTDIPLLYSIVPILALFLVQQLIAKFCLKSSGFRRAVCGSPVILIREGILDERAMRYSNYTVSDLCDQLRSQGLFDIGSVYYAILETNGSMSIMPQDTEEPPQKELSHMLILDGKICSDAVNAVSLDRKELQTILGRHKPSDVLYMQLSPSGKIRIQLKEQKGAKLIQTKRKEGAA